MTVTISKVVPDSCIAYSGSVVNSGGAVSLIGGISTENAGGSAGVLDGSGIARTTKAFSGLAANGKVVEVDFTINSCNSTQASQVGVVRAYGQQVGVTQPYPTFAESSNVLYVTQDVDGSGNFSAVVDFDGAYLGTIGYWLLDYVTIGLKVSPPPNAPTITAPSGAINTLTPSITFTTSNPTGGDSILGCELDVRRVSDDAVFWASGQLSQGSPVAYAGTTLVDGTQYKVRARNYNSYGVVGAWSGYTTFTPTINIAPTASLSSPIGGANVGTLTPTLTLNFSDPDSGTNGRFDTYQIQVQRQSDSSVFWDPGQVTTDATQKANRAAAVVYGGTVLVNNIGYKWRSRVQDGAGAWSAYTGWENFTPQTIPGPPTITTPSALCNTLTPTISGVYHQSGGGTEAAFQYEIRQNVTTIFSSADIAVAIATGQAYGGAPALAWGTSYSVRARSKDNVAAYSGWSGWQSFNTNAAPTAPSSITPSGGAIVPDTTPTVTWTHNDVDGDAQTAADIELYDLTAAAFVVNYNPKVLAQAGGTHDVLTALTLTHDYRMRVRTKGLAAPGYGPWSDYQLFTVATGPALAVTLPVPSQVQATAVMEVDWTFSGGSGTQQDYRVVIFEDDQVTVNYDSGIIAGTDLKANVPSGHLHNNETYYAQVTVRDTLSQTAVSSKVIFTTLFAPPSAVTGLVAQVWGDQSV